MPRTEAWGGGPALALDRSLDAACEAAGAMEEMLRDMADDAKRVTTEASMCVGRMAALWWCWLAAAPTSRPSLSPRARCDVARRVDCRSPSPALVLLTHTSHTHTHNLHSNPYIAKLEELDAAAAACTGAESLTLPLCFVARGDFERPEERDPQLQLTDLAKHCERSAQWDARVAEQFDVVAAALEGGAN